MQLEMKLRGRLRGCSVVGGPWSGLGPAAGLDGLATINPQLLHVVEKRGRLLLPSFLHIQLAMVVVQHHRAPCAPQVFQRGSLIEEGRLDHLDVWVVGVDRGRVGRPVLLAPPLQPYLAVSIDERDQPPVFSAISKVAGRLPWWVVVHSPPDILDAARLLGVVRGGACKAG